MRHSFRITIPAAACVLIALLIPVGAFLCRFSAYKAIREAIECGDENTALLMVKQLSKNRFFEPDWTIQGALPNWSWLHELDGWLFGCPTCRGNGYTLLQYAAARGQPRLAKTLLACGASVNLRGDRGAQVLTSAIGGGNTNIMANLIARGADPNSSNHAGSALHVAAGFARQPEVIELLLNAGANLNGLDSRGQTPQHERDCVPDRAGSFAFGETSRQNNLSQMKETGWVRDIRPVPAYCKSTQGTLATRNSTALRKSRFNDSISFDSGARTAAGAC